MNEYDWADTFHQVYDRGANAYRAGNKRADSLFDAADKAFLARIGCSAQELFDFIEDGIRRGEPSYDVALLLTALRREYFLQVQGGKPSGKTVEMDRLPAKNEKLGGIEWLPRIIEKAKAKLRGEMPPELMYCCGGDVAFLRGVKIHPADFLRFVWSVDGDPQKVLQFVRQKAR
jgi:hypothetical protein